jgi:hypothetical protein
VIILENYIRRYRMFIKKDLVINILMLLFFMVGCGDSKNCNTIKERYSGFENLELYGFHLDYSSHQIGYKMRKIEANEYRYTPYTFNFESNIFEIEGDDKQIFVNSERGSSNTISYHLNSSDEMVANEGEDIFKLSIKAIEEVTLKGLKEYQIKELPLKGKRYILKKEYLSNYYIINKLTSDEVFDNLQEFVAKYSHKPLTYGWIFAENGKLQMRDRDDNYVDIGAYKIKEIEGQETLFIYYNRPNQHNIHNCYLLDYATVWEAECHLKNSVEEVNFYNQEIYDTVEKYLQTNFIKATITI